MNMDVFVSSQLSIAEGTVRTGAGIEIDKQA